MGAVLQDRYEWGVDDLIQLSARDQIKMFSNVAQPEATLYQVFDVVLLVADHFLNYVQ